MYYSSPIFSIFNVNVIEESPTEYNEKSTNAIGLLQYMQNAIKIPFKLDNTQYINTRTSYLRYNPKSHFMSVMLCTIVILLDEL